MAIPFERCCQKSEQAMAAKHFLYVTFITDCPTMSNCGARCWGGWLEGNGSYHANPNWQHVGVVRAPVLKELFTAYQLSHSHFVFAKPSTFICAGGQGEQREKAVSISTSSQSPTHACAQAASQALRSQKRSIPDQRRLASRGL